MRSKQQSARGRRVTANLRGAPTDAASSTATSGAPDKFPGTAESRPQVGKRRAWAIALLLAALSTFSFLDRQILSLLLPDLNRSLNITDVQFGTLSGPAFIIVYNLTLIPAAFVVDRWDRRKLISIGAVIWTVMTIASAFAQSYNQLLLMRGGLAFGEALLGPAAISMIGDLFDRVDRPLPTAAYVTGSVIGTTGSAMLGAAVLQLAGALAPAFPTFAADGAWRLTLIGVGLPGLLLAIVFLLVAREPNRSREGTEAAGTHSTSLAAHLKLRWLLYSGVFLGYGFLSMVSTALAVWGPTHLIRLFDLSQVRAGYSIGTVSLIGGLLGTITLPTIFRALLRSGRAIDIGKLAVAAVAAAIGAAALGGYTTTLWICLIAFGAVMFLAMGVGTLPTLTIQLYTPSHLRGRISASLFFVVYLLASGITPVVIPLVAKTMEYQSNSLGKSIALVAVIVGIVSLIAFVASIRGFSDAEKSYKKAEILA